MHAFEFLDSSISELPHFCVLHGEEALLRRLVTRQLLQTPSANKTEGLTNYDGANASWRDVRDELRTRSLFGSGNRVVLVDAADNFVTANRPELEAFVEEGVDGATLILTVKSWPGNTRLAKATARKGLVISCRPPERKVGKRNIVDTAKLARWLVQRARTAHQLNVGVTEVNRVMEIVGDHLGLIDQELAKLALFVPESELPSEELIERVVGGWRQQTTWELIDAACLGRADRALEMLDRLLQSGESPLALFGAISWSLRRFAKACRVVEATERQGGPPHIREALVAAGFSRFPERRLDESERQMRQLGRDRADKLFQWLLDTDIRLKRTHSSPDRARWAIEMLLAQLAAQR